MWSRRQFIFSLLAGLAFWANPQNNEVFALGKRSGSLTAQLKPRLLAREYWAPALTCSFVDVFADNLCCVVDEFGHLGTANILSSAEHAHDYSLLGETVTIGSKVLYLKVIQPQLAVAITQRRVKIDKHASHFPASRAKTTKEDETGDDELVLVLTNLAQARAPQVVSVTPLSQFAQISGFAAGYNGKHPIVCLSGTDKKGNNSIALYGLKKNKTAQLLSTFTLTKPIKSLSLADKQLLVLHSDLPNRVSIIDISNDSKPHFVRAVELPGEVNEILCYNNIFAFSSAGDSNSIAIGDLKTFPKTEKTIPFSDALSIEGLALNNKYLFVVVKNEEYSTAIPFSIGDNYSLSRQKEVNFNASGSTASKIVLGRDCAFVTSNWAGVEALTLSHNGLWAAKTCSSIQKLPAAALVSSANYLLLAAADLQLYDIAQPRQPKLISTTKLSATIKTMTATGTYVLYLDKLGVNLCKIDNPKTILAKISVEAEHFSVDQKNHKGYLIQTVEESSVKKDTASSKNNTSSTENNKQKATKLIELNIFNNSIETSKTFSILSDSYCSSADEGYVLVGTLNSLAVYKPDQNDNELVCQHEFTNLAWRQIVLSKGNIFATAVDDNENGYFMTMSFDGQSISLLESIKIPHDGAALTIAGDNAFTSGQSADGSSVLTAIDISNLAKPRINLTKNTIESAAAITVNKNLAVVAGQGFEIFSF